MARESGNTLAEVAKAAGIHRMALWKSADAVATTQLRTCPIAFATTSVARLNSWWNIPDSTVTAGEGQTGSSGNGHPADLVTDPSQTDHSGVTNENGSGQTDPTH